MRGAGGRLFGQGILGSWVPRVWSGRGAVGRPVILMTVWAKDGGPWCFNGNHEDALHGNPPLPRKGAPWCEGCLGAPLPEPPPRVGETRRPEAPQKLKLRDNGEHVCVF